MYQEGKAAIKHYSKAFLNPEARLSRDLSVAFIAVNAEKGASVLDSTAATGIRAIRYALETKAKDVTLLEINESAYRDAVKNLKSNGVKAKALQKSIQEYTNTTTKRFDIIDHDPFGSIAPNLYDLMKVAKSNGFLLLTATDTAVLCGAQEKACRRIYDAKPLHNELCHEVGARILAGYVARTAGQFNFGIKVLLTISYAHYMRLFIQLQHGAEKSGNSVKQMGYAYYCSKCTYHGCLPSVFPRLAECPECGARLDVAGKLWAGEIYDKKIAREMRDYMVEKGFDKSGVKVLSTIMQEPDSALYYSIPKLTKKLGMPSVSPSKVIERLGEMGYSAWTTHFDNSSVRTDAPVSKVKEALNRGA